VPESGFRRFLGLPAREPEPEPARRLTELAGQEPDTPTPTPAARQFREPDPTGGMLKGRLVGIVAQADIALRENEKKTGGLVVAISEPSEEERR
jgi:hypothetical protein